jgi:hypothetical protein
MTPSGRTVLHLGARLVPEPAGHPVDPGCRSVIEQHLIQQHQTGITKILR